MNSVGIDIHKRYSVLVAVDERGQMGGRHCFHLKQHAFCLPWLAGLSRHSAATVEVSREWS